MNPQVRVTRGILKRYTPPGQDRGHPRERTGIAADLLGNRSGVGKTYAILADGRRRAGNGERVVVGWIDWHGRARTCKQLGDLEVIAPRTVEYRGTVFTDFDTPAAIASGAEVVLVDELAHATADRTRQRWQDVADVLHAGLDVVTTMNVAHLASVRDYAARITGVATVAWVPDEFVRSGEVVLIDLPAQALRQRIVGFERTLEQDAALGIRQLVDVACKALSPAVNDPYTAILSRSKIGFGRLPAGLQGARRRVHIR